MKTLKAFTLVEAIIAMGIMAVLLGFSTFALIQVKATIELQNGFSDVFSALQTAQNRARNSVTKPGTTTLTVPDYISIAFRTNTYAFQTCTKVSSRAICTDDTTSAKAVEVLNVTITPTNNCSTIAFSRLTGDISSVDGSGTVNSQGTCTLRILHTSTGNFREINIDLASNNIKST